MATITEFEELQVWKDSRLLVCDIYQLTKSTKDFDFNSQIRRAAISVMNNIAEGFYRGSTKEFIRFLHISKASCNEVKSMLYLPEDLNYASADRSKELRNFCQDLSVSISKFISYLESKLKQTSNNT